MFMLTTILWSQKTNKKGSKIFQLYCKNLALRMNTWKALGILALQNVSEFSRLLSFFVLFFPSGLVFRESESITHISESRNRHRMFFQQNIFDNCRVLGYICWNREYTKFNSNIMEQKNYINIYWTRSFLSTY